MNGAPVSGSIPEDALTRARTYDPVADAYERVNLPLLFEAPARELVAFASPVAGARVLDVGAGTGAVGRALLDRDPSARVTALDPSSRMLEKARAGGVAQVVVGALPDLPFATGVFDNALSAFVMTHVDDADRAALEMRRVLRWGGTLALAAWGPGDDEFARTWAEVAEQFVPASSLSAVVSGIMPGEARFARAEGLPDLLRGAGFEGVRDATLTLRFAMNADEFVDARGVCAGGRALRALLGPGEFERLRDRAAHILAHRFPSGIAYDRPVFLAAGTR